ncbi:unnamed protein product [Zymoseptoria tritici ST99CH_1A5]|uniref:Uncharacterized protein n=1 Tax=Zymoseptoria tritici ST99CH_1A5 TaxID=1276529 RepID=A0A1Y6LJ79_ZYMTR|nr:unnamed protein product [Zymoseptoria tritici ST99CH_1A5]
MFGTEGAPVSEVDNPSGLCTAVQSIRGGQANCVLVIGLDKSSNAGFKATVALVLISERFLTSHAYLKDSSMRIRACSMSSQVVSRTCGPNSFGTAARTIITSLRQAQLGAKDIQIVELLASDSGANRALGDSKFAKPQKASESPAPFVGTSGLAALCGLVWQLRGWAYNRPATQAQNTLLYTSNSAGGASVVILERSDGRVALQWDEVKDVRDGRERLGYNPAVEERSISHEDLEAVRARKEYTNEDGVKRLGLSAKGGDRAALSRL